MWWELKEEDEGDVVAGDFFEACTLMVSTELIL